MLTCSFKSSFILGQGPQHLEPCPNGNLLGAAGPSQTTSIPCSEFRNHLATISRIFCSAAVICVCRLLSGCGRNNIRPLQSPWHQSHCCYLYQGPAHHGDQNILKQHMCQDRRMVYRFLSSIPQWESNQNGQMYVCVYNVCI